MSEDRNMDTAAQKQEAAYLLPNDYLLHIKEADDGFSYAFFNTDTKQKDYEGTISQKDLNESPYSHLLTAARTIAQEDVGMAFIPAAEVSLRMLAEYPGSDVRRRQIFEPESLPKKDIRVIDSGYNELFRIPDGGYLQIQYPDRTFSAKCEHIDEYHSYVGGDCLHICQLAEIIERNGGTCRPENEIDAHEAAWRVGRNHYLAIQVSDEGYDYTLYDADFHEVDGGQIDNPTISMKEARNEILDDNGMGSRSLVNLSYDFVAERGEQVAQADMAEKMAALRSNVPSMDYSDAEEKYQKVEVFEKPALFSNGRVDRSSLPDGLYAYDLRGSDYDPGDPITLENIVIVNHAATVITAEKIDLPESGRLMLGEDGLNFVGGEKTMGEFLKEHAPRKPQEKTAEQAEKRESVLEKLKTMKAEKPEHKPQAKKPIEAER